MAKSLDLIVDSDNQESIQRIKELCDIILVRGDTLDLTKSHKYIEEHIDNKIKLDINDDEISYYAQGKFIDYIRNCTYSTELFAFSSDNKFPKFRADFEDYYLQYCVSSKSKISKKVPDEITKLFNFIQTSIDNFTIAQHTSIKIAQELTNNSINQAVTESKRAAEKAEGAAKTSEQTAIAAAERAKVAANVAAKKAVELAIVEVFESQAIEERINQEVEKRVNEEISKVSLKISETNATILSIFAGIVLAVVAGLFYSSSVIQSAASTNYYKLISIASLVGLVCYNLVALMFYFIEKLRGDKLLDKRPDGDKPADDKPDGDKPADDKPNGDKPDDEKLKRNKLNQSVIINIIFSSALIIIMLVSGIVYVCSNYKDKSDTPKDSNSGVQIEDAATNDNDNKNDVNANQAILIGNEWCFTFEE